MTNRRWSTGLFLAIALALGACSKPPPGQDGAKTAETAETGGKVEVPDAEAEAKRYYEQLVAQYGQDYAACGPSERTLPQECAAAKDIPGAGPATSGNVLLMLDASGSMAARIGGQTKMQAAQDALSRFAATLPAAANVALRVYGHTGNNKESGKVESCAGSALLYPFQQADTGKFEAAIRSFQPTGWTPIAASLDAAAQDFAGAPARGGANVVYVVSDGIETCGGDPVASARKLHESDIDVVVNVVGFDVNAQATRQLQAVATAGGGEYLAANSGADLNRIFSERSTEANKRFSCASTEQNRAFSETSTAQNSRFSCLSTNANHEFSDISTQANHDFSDISTRENSQFSALGNKLRQDRSLSQDQREAMLDQARSRRDAALEQARANRDHALSQATAKRDGILSSSTAERERVLEAATATRDEALEAETQARDERLRQAETERDAGTSRP
ncbi:MAG: VWA domain-containing protein [Pseudoxanthomonas sp.]